MRKVFIKREPDQTRQTLGRLTTIGYECKTLELPDKNNEPSISCIPKGKYMVRWTYSPAFQRFMYEVQGVKDRSGIRMHSANYTRQLRGCIALGSLHKDIDLDGTTDVIHSGKTCQEFENFMDRQDFELTIE